MMSSFDVSRFIICLSETDENLCIVSELGLSTLRFSCEVRCSNDLLIHLDNHEHETKEHSSCRKSFTRSSEIKKLKLQHEEITTECKTLRSVSHSFNWKDMCLFCCEFAGVTSEIRKVSTLKIDGNIQSKCVEREDNWALEVQG